MWPSATPTMTVVLLDRHCTLSMTATACHHQGTPPMKITNGRLLSLPAYTHSLALKHLPNPSPTQIHQQARSTLSPLGVALLFQHHPELEEYLSQTYDNELVATARLPPLILWGPLVDHPYPDVKSSNKPACGPHDLHPARNPAVPSAIKHGQPRDHHTGQPVQGRPRTAEPRHRPVLDSPPTSGSIRK